MSDLQLQALDWQAKDTIDFDPEYDDGSDYGSRYVLMPCRLITWKHDIMNLCTTFALLAAQGQQSAA